MRFSHLKIQQNVSYEISLSGALKLPSSGAKVTAEFQMPPEPYANTIALCGADPSRRITPPRR
jgi:hypothetical protein